jgi:hypothetical protein
VYTSNKTAKLKWDGDVSKYYAVVQVHNITCYNWPKRFKTKWVACNQNASAVGRQL